MTVTLNREQLVEATDVDDRPEIVEPAPAPTDVRELAALLAQAYIATPLFA